MLRITPNNSATSVTIYKFVVLVFGLLVATTNSFAQTDLCTTEPAGEVVVNGTSCTLINFDKSFGLNNGTAYWQNPASCGASKVQDTWGWFTAVSTQTTINYQATNAGDDVVLHLFDHCDPNMTAIACSDNTQGAGFEQITYNTVPGQIYHFRFQYYGSGSSFPGKVCVYSNVPITPPIITSIAPSSGCPGSTLVINGTDLLTTNSVKIGGTVAQIDTKTNTSVTVTVGAGTTGTIELTTQAGTTSSTDSFTITATVPTDPLGSTCNPFTNFSQVTAAIPDGNYSFNLYGSLFTTRVENGYLLIANDVGGAVAKDLDESSLITLTSRSILPTAILANLGNIEAVRIKSSNSNNGLLDVVSQDPTLLARVKQGITLHGGSPDNVINETWTGFAAAEMQQDASCPTSQGTVLKGNIVHTCGAFSGMNWIPNLGYRRINDSSGQVPDNVGFGLWVRTNQSLPALAQTNAAQNITSSTATLNGEVNPRLLTGTYEFEYGLTAVYNQTIAATPPSGSGDAIVPVTADVSSLQQNTTYHYRVKVTTADGVSYGSDQTFTTLSVFAPPTGNLIHNFEFNGNFNDSQPTGNVLSQPYLNINSYSTNPNQWNWTATQDPGGGLLLASTDIPNPQSYTLAIDFSFSETNKRTKIINFKDGNTDDGIYFLVNGIRNIDTSINLIGALSPNVFYKLIFTRAANNEFKTYIIRPNGGIELISTIIDTSNRTIPLSFSVNGSAFSFFSDDFATSIEYTPSGSVRFIKLWDGPLSETQLNALFASAIVATTLDAANITSSGATLFGEANPNSTNTTFSFEYGTTNAYGQTIAGNPATNNGNVTLPISADITGLLPNTTYHFRLKATNSSGDTFGADKTFTTPIQSFTSIEEASTVTTAGLYPFNINGTTFSAYVDANGWVLIANDVGAIVSQNLQEVSTLDATVRGVLTPTILSNLGNFNTLNLRSSDGVLDAFSNNATLISRVKQSQTLHQGVNDNAINDSWVGASSSNIKRDAFCTTSSGTTLKENIIHTCGNFIGTNWIPSIGFRRINEGSGNVANTISFGLWVKQIPPPVINTLSNLTGCIGSILTLNGNNLSTVQTVTIGGTPVTVVSTTDTAVTVRIAAGASGIVQVTALGGVTTASDNFTITFDANEPLGTGCNPFTSISQASAITLDGLYTFNINGTQFETKAEGGYLLVANDVGEPVSQNLPEVQTLDSTVRGILIPSILSELRFLSSIKIKSSDGLLDVTSNDLTLKSRISLGQTLHQGVNDNAINDTWTGASAANIKDDAFCTTSNGTTLKENIIHTCGSSIGTTWIPSQGVRRISDGSGNVANTVSFGLWAQISIPPTITSLSATSGFCGSSLVINGTFLASTQTVTIGGTPATIVGTTDTSVTVTVGSGTTGTVSVTTNTGTATSAETFTVPINPADLLGSVCNPFTSVNQVTSATPDGLYHFNLNGNVFETKVEGGWVLVLNDPGASVNQGLQVINSLDVTKRGILSNSILSNLGNINVINVKSSNGLVDVFSTNTTLISRLKASQTLHQGSNDNTINDSWTGVGAVYFTSDATCTSGDGNALNGNIIHTCGSFIGANWIPNRGIREITDASGFVGAGVSFGIWVQRIDPPTITSLSSLNG